MGLHLNDVVFFAACLLLAAVFAAAETALFALDAARMRDIVGEQSGAVDARTARSRARSLLRLWLERPDHVLTAILLGKHAAHVILVFFACLALENANE